MGAAMRALQEPVQFIRVLPTSMRALVAETNVVTRVTLTRILQRAGFTVEELHDELAAVSLLYQPDPPELAVLSLDTLIVDFAQICAAMREAEPDVFIVALVPEARRSDLVDIVSKSADDFLIKPVTLQEAEARILITQRLLAARHHGEPAPADTRPGVEAAEAEAAASAASLAEQAAALEAQLQALDFADDFRTVLGQMGLSPVSEVDPETLDDDFAYTAWTPMIVRHGDAAAWVNLRMDADVESTEHIYTALVRRGGGDEDAYLKLLRDIMGLAQDGLQQVLLEQDHTRVYTPILPTAAPTEQYPQPASFSAGALVDRACGLTIGEDVRLRLSLVAQPSTLIRRPVAELRPLDILGTPLQTIDDEVMLMREGTVMSGTYIGKIDRFVQTHSLGPEIEVFRPPTALSVLVHRHLGEAE